ncbi:helix-turn-helix domain-containing protein [Vibrio cholerae]|uniref:helix-turn-helix domain-containing protein n=1 Tax=Vibrio cholerae TaxID=666 RepID=UPI0020CBBB58|nr:helix-turn-helix transcriptional regulator [Vibrio cholerae]
MAKTIHDIDPIMQFFTQERLRKRLTQQQVAERAGVSLRMLQRLEQGERVVDIAQIRRLSAALEISVGHMIMHGAVSSPMVSR